MFLDSFKAACGWLKSLTEKDEGDASENDQKGQEVLLGASPDHPGGICEEIGEKEVPEIPCGALIPVPEGTLALANAANSKNDADKIVERAPSSDDSDDYVPLLQLKGSEEKNTEVTQNVS